MNAEQVKSLLNAVVAACGGGGIIGGWINANLTVELIGAVMVLAAAAWQLWKMTRKNMVVVVNAMPDVAGVITHNTPEGRALANSIPNKSVAVTGSVDAAVVARS